MKLTLSLLALALFLAACGQTEESREAQAYMPSEQEATVSEPVIADFVWNTTASDMTDEDLADIVTRWNARIDAAGYDMVGANILKPHRRSNPIFWNTRGKISVFPHSFWLTNSIKYHIIVL